MTRSLKLLVSIGVTLLCLGAGAGTRSSVRVINDSVAKSIHGRTQSKTYCMDYFYTCYGVCSSDPSLKIGACVTNPAGTGRCQLWSNAIQYCSATSGLNCCVGEVDAPHGCGYIIKWASGQCECANGTVDENWECKTIQRCIPCNP